MREFDDRITAPFGGYESAAQYYERSSAGPWLAAIDRPALLLAAQDDPMIPHGAVTRWTASATVRRETTTTGGHVGFVARSQAPGLVLGPGAGARLPGRRRVRLMASDLDTSRVGDR